MLEELVDRIMAKASEHKQDPRNKLIQFAGTAGIAANVLFAVVKVVIGIVSNSVSVLSDAINNLTDAVSSVITLIGLRLSRRPPDYKHPLGYGRLEYLSGMIISAIVLVAGIEFLRTSGERILNPQAVSFSIVQLVVLAISVVGKFFLFKLNVTIGKKADSAALMASGNDALSDVLVSTLMIISAIVSKFTGWMIDGYVGVIISVFILYTGIKLIRNTVSSILGERASKELATAIKAEVLKFEPIMGAYDLILHNYGPTTRLGSLNLEIPDYVTVERTYATMMSAQADIYEKYNIYFTFGLYSVNTYDESIKRMRNRVSEIVKGTPHAISLHAFNDDKDKKLIRFDVIVDFDVRDYEGFRKEIIARLKQEYPGYDVLINIDLDYA